MDSNPHHFGICGRQGGQDYVYGTIGTETCPNGYIEIADLATCVLAMASLEPPLSLATKWTYDIEMVDPVCNGYGCDSDGCEGARFNSDRGAIAKNICKPQEPCADGVRGGWVVLDGSNAQGALNLFEVQVNGVSPIGVSTNSGFMTAYTGSQCIDGISTTMCHSLATVWKEVYFQLASSVCVSKIKLQNRGPTEAVADRFLGAKVSIRSSQHGENLWQSSINSKRQDLEWWTLMPVYDLAFRGKIGQSCTDVCEEHGSFCAEEVQKDGGNQMDSAEKVKAAFDFTCTTLSTCYLGHGLVPMTKPTGNCCLQGWHESGEYCSGGHINDQRFCFCGGGTSAPAL